MTIRGAAGKIERALRSWGVDRERRYEVELEPVMALEPEMRLEYESRVAAGADPEQVFAELRARRVVERVERARARLEPGKRTLLDARGVEPAQLEPGKRTLMDDPKRGPRPAVFRRRPAVNDEVRRMEPALRGVVAREADGGAVDLDAARRIAAARSGGQPLDDRIRRELERAIGQRLDHLRVHVGEAADAAARSVGARAFALGTELFFRAGTYDPGSERGARLIAHEVAHAVQAGRGELPATPGLAIGAPGDAYEQAADRFADDVVRGRGTVAAPVVAGGAPAALRREPLSDDDRKELRELNGKAMAELLSAVEALAPDKRQRYDSQLDEAGVDVGRMRVALRAVVARGAGKTARDFAFEDEAMYAMCRQLGFRDQREAVFRFVEPGFKAPRPREPGSTVSFKDGREGVVHRGHIKRQAGKNQLPWMCNNPGAVGNGPSFKSPNTYPGKAIGPAQINIYPSEADGMKGLAAWITFQGKTNHMSFGGFFQAHAPKDDGSQAGNKGNDPEAYFQRVAGQMGLDPKAARGTPIASMDATKIAEAIRAVGEGYQLGGDTLKWPDDGKQLDRDVWFAMMYWEDKAPAAPATPAAP